MEHAHSSKVVDHPLYITRDKWSLRDRENLPACCSAAAITSPATERIVGTDCIQTGHYWKFRLSITNFKQVVKVI